MQRYQGPGRAGFLLCFVLVLLTACGSQSTPQKAATTSVPGVSTIPASTPTPAPTPTPPNVPRTLVHFTTQDHVQLAGWLFGKGGTTAIICSHELRGTKQDWSEGAPWLAARGYMVLAYDFRGWGDSQGQYDPDKVNRDLLAAMAFVQSHGAKKVILLGASLGADISLMVAASTKVAGVIALSPEYLFGLSNDQIKAISAPKLFVNSEGDAFASDTQSMFQNAGQPKDLHLYTGSAHGVAIFDTENGQDLIARILAFANRYAPLQ